MRIHVSWKFAEQDGVEDNGQQHRADCKQDAVPSGYAVSRVIQSNHALHCKSGTVACVLTRAVCQPRTLASVSDSSFDSAIVDSHLANQSCTRGTVDIALGRILRPNGIVLLM